MTEAIKRIVRIFKLRNARLLLLVRISGQSGDGLLQTALTSFILFSPERQNSAIGIAVAFGILLLPYSIVGPFVGIYIDKWSRQQILFWANLLRAGLMLAICLVVVNHGQNFLLAALVLTSLGATRFIQACLAASVPHVVTKAHLVTANAIFPTLGTTSAAIAAAIGIGGQRIFGATDRANATLILAGGACTIVASLSATRIKPRTVLGPHGKLSESTNPLRASVSELYAGIKILRKVTNARRSIFAAALQRFAFGITTIYALILSRTSWSTSGKVTNSISDFGACAGSAALGGFVAAIISALLLSEPDHEGHRVMRQAHLRLASIITCIACLPIIFIAIQAASLVSVCIAAFVIALTGQFLKINADTTIQATLDDVWRGRVFSIFDMLLNGSLVLGITVFALTPRLQDEKLLTSLVIASTFIVCAIFVRELKAEPQEV
ncbi:MAG: MFS transporter [Actinobacteria bacterium]|nr:MFS transporter [Actinomycetota bacterium]NBY15943.1 MFS transporter [Actinomycetota bacterium]